MKPPTADRADRAAAALVKKPNGVFHVRYENGYPVAIAIGKMDVVHLISGDTRTMACAEPLVELLNNGIRQMRELRELAERGA